MRKFLFNKVAVLGLGLIGGSLALDLRRNQLAKEVRGYNRSAEGRHLALRRKACDQVYADPCQAVQDSDLVVLAVPVKSIPALANKISSALKPGCLVTDVGSTKAIIVEKLSRQLPKEVLFIGGHPIAGTEQSGMQAAMVGLFKEKWWLLTPVEKAAKSPGCQKLTRLLKQLGAKVQIISPKLHDQFLAGISHLPHLLAYSLMTTANSFRKGKALVFAGSSFRDSTRVAASSAEMWADICIDNAPAILDWIKRYEFTLKRVETYIRHGSKSHLKSFFQRAAKERRQM